MGKKEQKQLAVSPEVHGRFEKLRSKASLHFGTRFTQSKLIDYMINMVQKTINEQLIRTLESDRDYQRAKEEL